MRDEWELWDEWHASTAESTGFGELGDPPPPPVRATSRGCARPTSARCPVYERLAARAI